MPVERYLAMVVRRYQERKEWSRKINEGRCGCHEDRTEILAWVGTVMALTTEC